MTEDEARRFFAGRHDWREHEWEDHCGSIECQEGCCLDNYIPEGDPRTAAERRAFHASILGPIMDRQYGPIPEVP